MKTLPKAKPQYVCIWYLEDTAHDFEQFEEGVVPHLKELLNRQLEADYSPSGIHPQGVQIKPRRLATVSEFVETVSKLAADEDDEAPTLILLDYFLPDHTGTEKPLGSHLVGPRNEDFFKWLERMVPGVPYRVLTSAKYTSAFQDKHLFKGMLKEIPRSLANSLKEVLLAHRPTFWQQLQAYAMRQVTSWHTPGHNKGTAFITSPILRPFYEAYTQNTTPLVFSSDLSVSVSELGDLSEPAGDHSMGKAMRRSSQVFGSSRTYFCTNGTSTANKTLLMTVLKPDEIVVVDRNCHKSVHQAIVLSGAIPFYITPRFNAKLKLWHPLSYRDIGAALSELDERGLQPRMLVLTTCTYDGILFPVREIAKLAHEKGILFHADEAWFPYGRFHPFYGLGQSTGRYNALDSDADFCVHSSHKALAAFSQASMIHVGSHFEKLLTNDDQGKEFSWLKERFGNFQEFEHQLVENLTFWLSTSPHYPMIATLDCATAQMYMEGTAALGTLLSRARRLHEWAADAGCAVTKDDLTGNVEEFEEYSHDILRFMVRVKPGRLEEMKKKLLNHQQQWEKSSERTLLFLVTLGTSESDVELLIQALEQCKEYLGAGEVVYKSLEPEISGQVVIRPQDAHYATGRYMSLPEIKDYLQLITDTNVTEQPCPTAIACHMVTPYPPGVPTILPGLPITVSSLDWIESILSSGGEVHGLMEGDKPKMRVLLSTDQELRNIKIDYAGKTALRETIAKLSQTHRVS